MKEAIATESAPAAVGAYSQAIVANGLVFCSGQIPIDPQTNELVSGTIADETQRCLDNLQAVLAEAGVGFENVVKVTAYLADIGDFAEFNETYASYAGSTPPARAAFAVKALPKGARVEIECIAAI